MRLSAISPLLACFLVLAACGDDGGATGTGTGSGSGSGGSDGDGGSDAGPTTTTTGPTTTATSSGSTTTASTTTTSSGQGGDPGNGGAGQGGDTTSQGGAGQGGDTTSQGGAGQGGDTTSQGGAGQGGETAGTGGGGGSAPAFVENCPGEYECSDGECIAYAWFCDGDPPDCSDGIDESADICGSFLDGSDVCGSGITYINGEGVDAITNTGLNLCAGAECCEEFQGCVGTGSEADIQDCLDCLAADGGSLCDDVLECMDANCGSDSSAVCDTTITYQDVEDDYCIDAFCCEDYQLCVGDGSEADVILCLECLNAGEPFGDLCADAASCQADFCPPDAPLGICDSGITSTDQSDDECLTALCCDDFLDCTGTGSEADINLCIECLLDGGGNLCDAALDCTNTECP